jgi:hypothetical protein
LTGFPIAITAGAAGSLAMPQTLYRCLYEERYKLLNKCILEGESRPRTAEGTKPEDLNSYHNVPNVICSRDYWQGSTDKIVYRVPIETKTSVFHCPYLLRPCLH